jgi:hypothetical protein
MAEKKSKVSIGVFTADTPSFLPPSTCLFSAEVEFWCFFVLVFSRVENALFLRFFRGVFRFRFLIL